MLGITRLTEGSPITTSDVALLHMITAKARKTYKSCDPGDTCSRIDKILFSIGLETTSFLTNSRSDAPSVRLNIANDEFLPLSIGTNGKGMTTDFARASAYGEFMERLENGLISNRLHILHPREVHAVRQIYPEFIDGLEAQGLLPRFMFAPDEVLCNKQHCRELTDVYICASTKSCLDWPHDDCYCVPFWSYGSRKVELLPYEIIRTITGTNGMCAGNEPTEAMVQGLSEIIERYVLTRLIKDKITPPDIPEDFFKGYPVLDHLMDIKRQLGCELHIKDCSLGEGWPAIGLLLLDRINRKYYFHMGADISPVTALERCLSETFQGSDDILFKPIDINSEIRLRSVPDAYQAELIKNCSNDSGYLPSSLYAQRESYAFNSQIWEKFGGDDNHDIHRVLEQIHQHGFNIYIRDVSYLNFPAYHIYVPGMSDIKTTRELLNFLNEPRFPRFLRAHHPSQKLSALRQLSEDVAMLIYAPRMYALANGKELWQSGNIRLLQGILLLRAEEWEKASKLFSNFAAEERNPFQSLLYRYASDISVIKGQAPDMESLLEDSYTESFTRVANRKLFHEALEDMFDIAPCFDCSNCKLRSECRLTALLALNRKIEELYAANVPDQSRFSEIISQS